MRGDVERVVGPMTGDGNPLDAWGNGDFATNLPHALAVLDSAPDIDAIVFCHDSIDDAPTGRPEQPTRFAAILRDAAAKSAKPHYQMNMRSGLMNMSQVSLLRNAGVPTIGGVATGLGAISKVHRWATWAEEDYRTAPNDAGSPEWSTIVGRKTVNEFDSKRLLLGKGLRTTEEILVGTFEQARNAALEIGYPVVLKAVSDDLPHKSEFGLVKVGVANEQALRDAWQDIQSAVSGLPAAPDIAGMLIQEMIPDGIEVFAGVTYNPEFGHSLAFGLGGVAIEVMRDFSMRMLPLRTGDAASMIEEIHGAPLLKPYRGRPGADVGSLARCLEALSGLVRDEAVSIREIDLNPIKVLPDGQGCIIVDALIVPTVSTGG